MILQQPKKIVKYIIEKINKSWSKFFEIIDTYETISYSIDVEKIEEYLLDNEDCQDISNFIDEEKLEEMLKTY